MKRNRNLTLAAALLISVLACQAAWAQKSKSTPAGDPTELPVINPSFEMQTLEPGQWTINQVTGWTPLASDNWGGVWHNLNLIDPAILDGNNVLWVSLGGFGQVLSTTIQPMTDYTFYVTQVHRNNYTMFPMTIEFAANGEVLGTCTTTLTSDRVAPASGMELMSLTYASGSVNPAIGELLEIRIVGGNNGAKNWGNAYAENVHVTATPYTSGNPTASSLCSVAE